MNIQEIRKYKKQIDQIAAKYGIKKVYIFGSVARAEDDQISDIDFLIEMEDDASALGVGGFQYEVQQLLGVEVDVVPTFALSKERDVEFVRSIETEAVAL
ncbi:MAG: nucleotidyltransferase domain-containing protein [Anaerolineales bacterium]